jgi:hypothetical protein
MLAAGMLAAGMLAATASFATLSQAQSAGCWSAGASMAISRNLHTAIPLADGTVVVAGGRTSRVPGGLQISTGRAERFDPATGRWSDVAQMATARDHFTATRLRDGSVLAVGGRRAYSFPPASFVYFLDNDSAERWHPRSNTWTPTAAPAFGRALQSATLLSDGRVLVAGGEVGATARSDPVVSNTAELYDPVTNKWTRTGSMKSPRFLHAAALLRDGRVLVAGGYGADNKPIATAEIFDPAVGRWQVAASLPSPHGHPISALLPGGDVLVAGGESAVGRITATAAVYQQALGQWRAVAPMPGPRNAAASTSLLDGDVFVASGFASFGGSGAVLASYAFAFDVQTRRWRQAGRVATPRTDATATLLPAGRVLIGGGWDAQSAPLASTEIYHCGTTTTRAS